MKVLLLQAPFTRRSYLGRFSLTEPLTNIFLGPVLAPRHEVRAIDLRVLPDLEAQLGDFRPDAVVLAVMQLSHGTIDAVLGRLLHRHPAAKVLLVGAADYGVTHLVERPLDYATPLADAIVPGYYLAGLQRVVPQVLAAWEQGRQPLDVPGILVRTTETHWERTAPGTIEVGPIGVPDRTLLGRARGRYRMAGIGRMAYLMHTAGCPYACRFCTMSKEGPEVHVRPVAEVMQELEGITEPHVFLSDFEPLQAPEAMRRLVGSIEAAGIRKRYYMLTRADSVVNQSQLLERWRDAGLTWVYLGLDGHSPERLRQIGKGSTLPVHAAALEILRRLGIHAYTGITVSPDFGPQDFADLRRAVHELRPPIIDFTVETPLVGTRLFDQTQHLLTTRDWSLYDLNHAVLPTRLGLDEFYRELAKLHLMAWRLSASNLLRATPLRDSLHNARVSPGALWHVLRAARDHGALAGAPVAA